MAAFQYEALNEKGALDKGVMAFAFLGVSAPQFALGLILLYVFAYRLALLPLGGYGTPQHLVLPALTLAVTGAGGYARVVRSAMLETLQSDYIRTGTAKGLARRCVVLKHALRNAALPVVAMIGLDIGLLMGGAATHVINPLLHRRLPYDAVKDFAAVTGLGKGGQVLVVNAASPHKSVTELLAFARRSPGKLSFGSGSSSSRVAGEMFKQLAGVDILHVPYKSNPLALTDLLVLDSAYAELTAFASSRHFALRREEGRLVFTLMDKNGQTMQEEAVMAMSAEQRMGLEEAEHQLRVEPRPQVDQQRAAQVAGRVAFGPAGRHGVAEDLSTGL